MAIPTLSGIMRQSLIGCVATAARCKIPQHLERPATRLTVASVGAYRHILSSWLGQQCLFRPSCSERAIACLQQFGWNQAIQEIHRQLDRCCGNFIVRFTPAGQLELETSDGTVFTEEQLSPFVLAQYRPYAEPCPRLGPCDINAVGNEEK